jgi:glutamine synthetase
MNLAQRCGLAGAQRQAQCSALLQRLRDTGVAQLRVTWCDLHGQLRSKALVCGNDAAAVADALLSGVGMVSTVLLKDSSDRTAFKVFEPGALQAQPALRGFGAANNVLLLPDPASFLPLPWAPATGWLRAEPFWEDGTAVAACPRRVLQRALAQLHEAGFGLRCGLEVEFHIYRIVDDVLAADSAAWPAEPPALQLVHPGYHLLADAHLDLAEAPLTIVQRTAQGLGLPLRSLEIELGPSQFEAVFAPTDALTAADQMVLFRNGVRQALRRAGYHASFVCRPPLPQAVASGWHLHQSLVDMQGRPAMVRAAPAGHALDARQVLSDAGAHWLGGLLAHAPGMAALCAPSIPAYSRFQGSVMAPQALVWGRDNRGALLRVVGQPGDEGTRIENRIAEPAANPHLALASQVLAGLDGIRRQLEPGPASEDPYAAQARRLPGSLGQALAALRQDSVLQQGLGETMATVFHAVKQHELERHAQAQDTLAWERREYFSRQ